MIYARVLYGLDQPYYQLIQNAGRLRNDMIGAKTVGTGKVIFIGNHLSQNLKAVYIRNWGSPTDGIYPSCFKEVKTLLEDVFRTYGTNDNFWPDAFPVEKVEWNYKGVNFDYSSQAPKKMTLSVTYTPRWKATVDGEPLAVGQSENLVTLALPAGPHHIELVYGTTKYGVAGYAISLIGLMILLVFLKFYDIISYQFKQICVGFGKFLRT